MLGGSCSANGGQVFGKWIICNILALQQQLCHQPDAINLKITDHKCPFLQCVSNLSKSSKTTLPSLYQHLQLPYTGRHRDHRPEGAGRAAPLLPPFLPNASAALILVAATALRKLELLSLLLVAVALVVHLPHITARGFSEACFVL